MYVNPAVEPAVTAAAVRSTVAGAHTAAGLFITTVGLALIVTTTGWMSEHPAALVPTI